jgi:6-pyruvoyltetrahydropterin/6-carboxytetrahydropterin synthase|tara:strand:- start:191 stop:550 length:360 start_codon:yes stop_codon:yes gene_type:complete
MKIFKDFSFEAAHKLPLVPKSHKCSNLHGHSFKVRICVTGIVNELGWVMDFADLKLICAPVVDSLDHTYLNEIKGLENPTSENISKWLWMHLQYSLKNLESIEVMETCNSGCIYMGEES